MVHPTLITNGDAVFQHSVEPAIRDPDAPMASEPTLSSLAELVEQSEAAERMYGELQGDPSSSADAYKVHLRRQYIRTLHKVIEESDIVILVLDARDPEGCRSRLVEEEVRRREHEGKKLVFVLNKIGAQLSSPFLPCYHTLHPHPLWRSQSPNRLIHFLGP